MPTPLEVIVAGMGLFLVLFASIVAAATVVGAF